MSRLDKDDDERQARRRAARTPAVLGRRAVPVLSLDTWIAQTEQPPPTLVKIDIEGAEIGALRGMSETLRSARPTLIIEPHGTRKAVVELLDSFGYAHRPIERDVPVSESWRTHLLAQPKSTA